MNLRNLLLIALTLGLSVRCANNSEEDPQPQNPLETDDFIAFVDENPSQDQVLGTIDASTTEGTLSFSLTSQSPAGAIAVDEETGSVTVADPTLFVFDTNPQITGTVNVTNGTESASISLTVVVNEPGAPAVTIWTGAKTTFTKGNETDPNDAANQDRLTDNVWITRGNNGGPIYNAVTESSSENGPAGTAWAQGSITDVQSLNFTSLRDAAGGGRTAFRNIPDKTFVLHLTQDNIYLEVTFLSWSQGRAGGFSYERATP